MDFPFIGSKKKEIENLEQKVSELEDRIEELKTGKEKLEKRFESERERRSKLSSEKQQAQKELKKARQKLESQTESTKTESESKDKYEMTDISVKDVKEVLSRIETVRSESDDLVTVISNGELSEIEDYRGLKNTLSADQIQRVSMKSPLAAFIDDHIFDTIIRTRSFTSPYWKLDDNFDTEKLCDFIESSKNWIVVSAGQSLIIEEENGRILDKTEIKTRVDRKHTQGGFSQKRFERKRQEQIDEHLDELKAKIDDETDYLILGDRKLAKKLEGDYLGGFDDNRPLVDALYGFQISGHHG